MRREVAKRPAGSGSTARLPRRGELVIVAAMPAVSVVMVFHRVTPFLTPAVRSVLTQTQRDLELILVDNGTGAGLAPLGEWGRDDRLRLVPRPANDGIAAGHNAGLALAQGAYVVLLDSDDCALPTRVERQVAALAADPDLGLVSSGAETIDPAGVVIGRQFALVERADQLAFSAYSMPAPTPSLAGRREIFQRFPYRPEFRYAMDYDFFARAAEAGATRGIPEPLLQYRVHPHQVTRQYQTRQVREAGVIRLLTARRRAGRAEELAELLAATNLDGESSVGESYRSCAEQCLREKFPVLAVYHARKALRAQRSGATLAWAGRVFTRAARMGGGSRAVLWRMLWGGPLRAHGLRPL